MDELETIEQIIKIKEQIKTIQEKRDEEIKSIKKKENEEWNFNIKNLCESLKIDRKDIILIIPSDEAKTKQKKVDEEISAIKWKTGEEIRILENEIRKIKKPMKIIKYENELQNVIEKINKDDDKTNYKYLGKVGRLLEKLIDRKDIDTIYCNAKKSYLNMLAKSIKDMSEEELFTFYRDIHILNNGDDFYDPNF